jgi:hypothetical protein
VKRFIAGLIATGLVVAGCSSSGGGDAATSGPAGSPPARSAPANGLTGIGASLDEWNAAHQADPDPKLVPNCCYGPFIPSGDAGRTMDTWAAVQSSGTVYSYLRSFPAGTSDTYALSLMESQDLPSDAVRVVDNDPGDGSCELFVYHSARLAQIDPTLDYVSFDLHSESTDEIDSTNIQAADVTLSGDADPGSC